MHVCTVIMYAETATSLRQTASGSPGDGRGGLQPRRGRTEVMSGSGQSEHSGVGVDDRDHAGILLKWKTQHVS